MILMGMPKKKRKSKPKKPGRPTKFTERLAGKILDLAKTGHLDKQIAEECGIALSTLNLWKAQHPSFSEAIKSSKDVATDMVEAALFRRAIGYSHPETKIIVSEVTGIATEEITKHYPPDTKAAEFWLKNRRPKKWREKSEVEVGKLTLEALIAASKLPDPKEDEDDGED